MMKLHLDKYAFDTIISNISKRSNLRRDILEKDYYVTLMQISTLYVTKIKYYYQNK